MYNYKNLPFFLSMFSTLRRFILFVLYGIRPNKSDIVPELSDQSQMSEALFVTALGIIAGLSAHSLIMAVSSLNEGNYVKFLWGIVLAFLLGVASLARMKSHYVYGTVRYDNTFALLDVAYIVANSFAIGLMDSHHFPKRAFWISVAFIIFMAWRGFGLWYLIR